MDRAEAVEACVAKQLRPMLDQQISVVFYDLTTVRIHRETQLADDVRAVGMSKDTGGIARQFVLGVVQSAEGLPLMHTVHAGNVAEARTLQQRLQTVMARFPIERVILVADRGLLSLDNVAELSAVAEASSRQLQFILAVPARRYAELGGTLDQMRFHQGIGEGEFAGHRLPERIRAHARIRFLALVLYRVMRLRLKASASPVSPKTALELLGRIQTHRATIGKHAYSGMSKATQEQLDLFDALELPAP